MIEEKEYWLKFLNKHISVIKKVNEKDRYYNGILIDVFDDKIVILDDYLKDNVILSFDDLSLVNVREELE